MARPLDFAIPRSLAEVVRPDRLALVVYDMQVGVVRQLKNGAEITQRVGELLEAARSNGYRCVFLRHMSVPKDWMGVFQYRQAMVWQRTSDPAEISPWFLRDNPGFEIVPELAPRPNEVVLDKVAFSAFEGTPLAMLMRDVGLNAFAICGVATEIGIDPTVRHGADLGLIPVVASDACGGGHAEAADRSLANLAFMGDAIMIDTGALATAMAAAGRSS